MGVGLASPTITGPVWELIKHAKAVYRSYATSILVINEDISFALDGLCISSTFYTVILRSLAIASHALQFSNNIHK